MSDKEQHILFFQIILAVNKRRGVERTQSQSYKIKFNTLEILLNNDKKYKNKLKQLILKVKVKDREFKRISTEHCSGKLERGEANRSWDHSEL